MSLCRIIMSTFVMTVFFCSTVAADNFPHGCEVSGFGFSQDRLVVNDDGQQTFYLIQNRSNVQIELQRFETREVFMSPSLTVKLDPSNWAAFASDIANLNFQCFSRKQENTPENETNNEVNTPSATPVDCRTVLDVCQYPRVKFALSNMGNYWVSTNKSQQDVINEATRKGIYLRW
ncbi:enhanced entry protein EnhB [Legionella sp. 29fVS95]|uniref:enhanced entry protein EnhB n=1 Tax=Legionella sp. 29fVS95 TaxID=3402813 RepID=UPI003AF68F04